MAASKVPWSLRLYNCPPARAMGGLPEGQACVLMTRISAQPAGEWRLVCVLSSNAAASDHSCKGAHAEVFGS